MPTRFVRIGDFGVYGDENFRAPAYALTEDGVRELEATLAAMRDFMAPGSRPSGSSLPPVEAETPKSIRLPQDQPPRC